jgi:hypothetical protein
MFSKGEHAAFSVYRTQNGVLLCVDDNSDLLECEIGIPRILRIFRYGCPAAQEDWNKRPCIRLRL